jgi:hypothetical protein
MMTLGPRRSASCALTLQTAPTRILRRRAPMPLVTAMVRTSAQQSAGWIIHIVQGSLDSQMSISALWHFCSKQSPRSHGPPPIQQPQPSSNAMRPVEVAATQLCMPCCRQRAACALPCMTGLYKAACPLGKASVHAVERHEFQDLYQPLCAVDLTSFSPACCCCRVLQFARLDMAVLRSLPVRLAAATRLSAHTVPPAGAAAS